MDNNLIQFASASILKAELEQVGRDLSLLDDMIFYHKQFSDEPSRLEKLFDRRAILREYEVSLTAEVLARYFAHIDD